MFPDVGMSTVPGRHVVLGLRLAELANSAGHPLSVDIPAAHLPRPWPALLSLWLLHQKKERGGGKDQLKGLEEDNADVYRSTRALSCPIYFYINVSLGFWFVLYS